MSENIKPIREKRVLRAIHSHKTPDNRLLIDEKGTLIEKVLISRLKAGDISAFTHIFTAYYKDLVLFALRFIKDPDSAEEIVQDTFVKYWEDRESISIDSSLKGYLIKSVRNKCLDRYRHNKIVNNYNSFVSEKPPVVEYDTDGYLLFSELQEKLDFLLEKLPQEYTTPFKMNRFNGLKYHEIAKILNVSVRTIEVRIGKALSLLRYHLRDYFIILMLIITYIASAGK